MSALKLSFLVLMMTTLSPLRTWAAEEPKYTFHLPEYPGTQSFQSLFADVPQQYPFATTMRVYKTKDHAALDQTKVIAFFREALAARGWTVGDRPVGEDEPYLRISTQVYENLPDGTHIQASGDFQLWVAPKDGMFTILFKQWRISSLDQSSHEQVAHIIKTLWGVEKEKEYRDGKLQDQLGADWERWYENEYMVEHLRLDIVDSAIKRTSCLDFSGILIVSLLSYKDTAQAQVEAEQLREKNLVSLNDAIVVVGKTLVLIEDPSYKQKEKVAALVTQIRALQK